MDISLIALQNPWWSDKEKIKEDSKVKAVLENGEKLVRRLEDKNLVLIGPRQTGKTTALLYDIYLKIMSGIDPKQIMYFSFDTVKDYSVVLDVLRSFVVDEKRRFVYLDEVSFVKDWQRAVKFFLDSGMSKNVRVYVTGSSSINLKKELMPGRQISIEEFVPLSFREFLLSLGSDSLKSFLGGRVAKSPSDILSFAKEAMFYFSEISKLFSIYTVTGGYPLPIVEYLKNSNISSNTYDIYWNSFVSDISKAGKSVEIATSIILQILQSYSSHVSLSSIARSQGIGSHVTVREYLETMHDLFVINEAFALDTAKVPVFRKERKIYFNDPFLFRVFSYKLGVMPEQAESKIVEGIVHQHLYRFVNRQGAALLKFGYSSQKREIDFLIGDYAIEVKWQSHVTQEDMPRTQAKHKLLLSKDTLDFGKIPIVPVPIFLAFL